MLAIIPYNMQMDTAKESLDEPRLDFGAALRYYRNRAGIKQDTLVEMLGIPQSRLSRWENQSEPPKDTYLLSRLAKILGVSLETLYSARIPAQEMGPPDLNSTDDPLGTLARYLYERHGGRISTDELLEVMSGFLALGDEERRHVRMQIGLLRRIPSHPPNSTNGTPNDAGGRD